MKPDTRHHLSWGSRIRLFSRVLGLTALLAMGAGVLLLHTHVEQWWTPENLTKAGNKELGEIPFLGVALLALGTVVVVVGLLVELGNGIINSTGRRSVAGVNATLQTVIAIGLLAAVNFYSFSHSSRFDLTREKEFTLPPSVVTELSNLKDETTIIVLQQHKTTGQLSVRPDRYDYAAERQIVERVKDLVEQFRQFGPQFKVHVLDVEEEDYDKQLQNLTKDNPELREAIRVAPENSIFFCSGKRVQRLSFNEFYQLDKTASKAANNGRGNLVLHPQGLETLVHRITAIEEKRPKVAVAVCHEWLTTQVTQGQEEFTLAGLKKALTDHGFDVMDIVLKKNFRRELEGDPASYTYQETKLVRLEQELEEAEDQLRVEKRFGERLARARLRLDDARKKLDASRQKPRREQEKTLEEVIGVCESIFQDIARRNIRMALDERNFEVFEQKVFAGWETQHREDLKEAEEDLARIQKELQEVRSQERSLEDRYLSDVKVKFNRLLSDCDLLIIPRLTIINATIGSVLPRGLHRLDKQQAEVIKEFMKAGKPVLICAGPTNVPGEDTVPPPYDDVERLLADRGIEMAPQTILFNVESKAFRAIQAGNELGGNIGDIPPLSFASPEEERLGQLKPNPIGQAMQVLVNSIDQPLEIRMRALRPITVSAAQEKAQGFYGTFLWTSPRSWNERYPFDFTFRPSPFGQGQMIRAQLPPPRLDSSSNDPKAPEQRSDERRGPFSVGVAVESRPPESWYTDKDRGLERKKSRVAVIGHGGIFTKPELSPATGQLLLVTCNWLLHREERMPRIADEKASSILDRPWKYPRVEMSDGTKELWHWGTFLGLPAVFAYVGLIVLMFRRVR